MKLSTALLLAGFFTIVAGACLIWVPVGLVLAGVLLLGAGVATVDVADPSVDQAAADAPKESP